MRECTHLRQHNPFYLPRASAPLVILDHRLEESCAQLPYSRRHRRHIHRLRRTRPQDQDLVRVIVQRVRACGCPAEN